MKYDFFRHFFCFVLSLQNTDQLQCEVSGCSHAAAGGHIFVGDCRYIEYVCACQLFFKSREADGVFIF